MSGIIAHVKSGRRGKRERMMSEDKMKEKTKRPRCPACGYGIHNYYNYGTQAECKRCLEIFEVKK